MSHVVGCQCLSCRNLQAPQIVRVGNGLTTNGCNGCNGVTLTTNGCIGTTGTTVVATDAGTFPTPSRNEAIIAVIAVVVIIFILIIIFALIWGGSNNNKQGDTVRVVKATTTS